MKVHAKTITRNCDQCECSRCFEPIYTGQNYYTVDGDPNILYCSRYCAAYHYSDTEHEHGTAKRSTEDNQ